MLWEFSSPNNKEIYNLSNETYGIILKQVCTFFHEMGIVCLTIHVQFVYMSILVLCLSSLNEQFSF